LTKVESLLKFFKESSIATETQSKALKSTLIDYEQNLSTVYPVCNLSLKERERVIKNILLFCDFTEICTTLINSTKQCSSPKIKHFGPSPKFFTPPNFWAGYATVPAMFYFSLLSHLRCYRAWPNG